MTDTLGSILMVGITIVMFTGLSVLVFAGLRPVTTVHADVVASLQGGNVVLTHQGGEALTAGQTQLLLTIGGQSCTYTGTTGPNALFTASQFGGVDHHFTFQTGDIITVAPVSPCTAIGNQPVSVALAAKSGSSTVILSSSIVSAPGVTCATDLLAPTVNSWTTTAVDNTGAGQSDVTLNTTGPVVITAALVDDCSGAADGVAPAFQYRIVPFTTDPAAPTPSFTPVAMTHVGLNVWQASVPDPTWASQTGKSLQYYLSGMTDLASPANVGVSPVQNDPIQGLAVGYRYPTTCTMATGSVWGTDSHDVKAKTQPAGFSCPASVAGAQTLPVLCPNFVAQGPNVLYRSDCNEQANFTEGQGVLSYVPGNAATPVTGSFIGSSCPAADSSAQATSTSATTPPDGQYACFSNHNDALRTYGMTAVTGTISGVEVHVLAHLSIDAGGAAGTGHAGGSDSIIVKVYRTTTLGLAGSVLSISAQYYFSDGTCTVSGVGGTCTGSPSLAAHECAPTATSGCSGSDQDLTINIFPARTATQWAAELSGDAVEVTAATNNLGAPNNDKNHVQLDAAWLRVTTTLPTATINDVAPSVAKLTGTFTGSSCGPSYSGGLATGLQDGQYACFTGNADKLQVTGFSGSGGNPTKVELAFTGHFTGALLTDKVDLKYRFASSGAFTDTGTQALTSTDSTVFVDITGAGRSWADVGTLWLEADAVTSSLEHMQMDALWVRVTTASGSVSVANIYATTVVTADTPVLTSYHAELQPDNLYAQYTTSKAKETVGGFVPLSGTISKVEIVYEGHCLGTVAKPCGATDKVTVSYKVGAFSGGSVSTVQSGTDTQIVRDVTAARAWSWNDLNSLTITAQAATHDDAVQTYVDALWVRVTASGIGGSYSLDAQLGGFTASGTQPATPVQNVLEMRYQLLGTEKFLVQVCQDNNPTCGSWVTRGPTLASTTYFVWSYPLTVAEYNAGAPRVRLIDVDPLDGTPDGLGVEYMRVGSS